MKKNNSDKAKLELIDKVLGEDVDMVNRAYFRLRLGLYNLFFLGILTGLSFFLELGIISWTLLGLSIIVLVFVGILMLMLNDKKINLRISVMLVKSMGPFDNSNGDIVEKQLGRLEPQEYLPKCISEIYESSQF